MINENGRYNPNIPEEGHSYGHALSFPIFMLIVTAIISIEMKPESITEFGFPTGSYWQDHLKENSNKLICKFSGEARIYIIDYLLYGEFESERTVSTPIDGRRKVNWQTRPGRWPVSDRGRCRWPRRLIDNRTIDR